MQSYERIISYIEGIEDKDLSSKLKEFYEFLYSQYPDAMGGNYKHQVWKGGYYDHVLDCIDMGNSLYQLFISKRELNFTFDDVIVVLLIHDVEKPVKQAGNCIEKSNMKIRTDFCNKFQISITEKQHNAIKYIHGEGDDYSKTQRIMNPLAAFCHILDTTSARIFYEEPNKSGYRSGGIIKSSIK